MGFHEKSAWAALGAIVLVFVPYFVVVFQHPMAYIGMFVLAVMVQVVLLTVFHVVNALATPEIRKSGDTPKLDELDRWIELRAAKLSSLLLSVVVMSWCMAAGFLIPTLAGASGTGDASRFVVSGFQAAMGLHVLFAGFVLVNVIYYATIVTGYRRLARG